MEFLKNFDNYIKNCINNDNYDILSIIDFININEKDILDIYDIIKNYYNYNDRNSLYKIKEYYENIFYKYKTDLLKTKYIMILCIGNIKNNKEIFLKYFKNLKNQNIDNEIINLEKRLIELKYGSSDDSENENDKNDKNNGSLGITTKKIKILSTSFGAL